MEVVFLLFLRNSGMLYLMTLNKEIHHYFASKLILLTVLKEKKNLG